jgi:dTDP-4-amino-4,6-dideoxygalactose transaminase
VVFGEKCHNSGGKNRELTECQVHTAIAELIPSWWLGLGPSKKLLERTAAEIERTQKRNASARKSHTKATRKKLRALGIKLTEVPRCTWGKT